jgi:Eukaryotic aspartyl protease
MGDWTITVDGFAIGDDTSTSTYKFTADVDTGSTLMAIPKQIADLYYSEVAGAMYDQKRFGGYVFSCDAVLPDFSLIISGQKRTGELFCCFKRPHSYAQLRR